MDTLQHAADRAAREFLKGNRPTPDFTLTVTRNAILDCLHSSTEPDFIAKICTNGSLGAEARRIIDKVAPHLPTLAGRVVMECRA